MQQAVLGDVIDFRTRFWDAENDEWSDAVVYAEASKHMPKVELPAAIEVSVVLKSEAMYSYIFQVL